MEIPLASSTVSQVTANVSSLMGGFGLYIVFIIGLLLAVFVLQFAIDVMRGIAAGKQESRRDFAISEAHRGVSERYLATELGAEGYTRDQIEFALDERDRFENRKQRQSIDDIFGIE